MIGGRSLGFDDAVCPPSQPWWNFSERHPTFDLGPLPLNP